jgi:hypothetical protein
MNEIFDIINEVNKENGSNYKISILKKYKDHQLLKRVLKMTYDNVQFNYGVGKTTIEKVIDNLIEQSCDYSLIDLLNILEEKFVTREITGNAAIEKLKEMYANTSKENRFIITKVIERDLRINLGKTVINKVFPNLITKPIYMRCDTYSKKTAKNISFPAFVQLKADGTYREFNVDNGVVSCQSRSGEKYEYPVLFENMKKFPDGIYTGELTIVLNISNIQRLKQNFKEHSEKFQSLFDEGKTQIPRSISNGLINSDNPPHDDIILELWDYITHDEYYLAGKKDKKNQPKTFYLERWNNLVETVEIYNKTENIKVIQFKIVNSLKEALEQTSDWMNKDYEGAILKDYNMTFKDGTSKQQLKLKLEISTEMRCIGFSEGTKGTKRENKVGAIIFENDEKTIKGKCSGFTDIQMDYFTENQDLLIGKILEVQFNDLSKAQGNEFYALSHPRFVEFRDDKDETDTIEKVFKLRKMAMELS